MRLYILIVLCFMSTSLFADGNEGGNGGNFIKERFIRACLQIETYFKSDSNTVKIDVIKFQEIVSTVKIVISGKPLFDKNNVRVDALNYPKRVPQEIHLYSTSWERQILSNIDIDHLVLHEILGLMELNDDRYERSYKLLEGMVKIELFHFDEDYFQCINSKGVKGYNFGFVGECGDFRGQTLSEMHFENKNLKGSIFEDADLSFIVLSNSDLSGAVFDHANLSFAELDRTKLDFTSFTRAKLESANFSSASGEMVDFTEANLTEAIFKRATLAGSVFYYANLKNTNFKDGVFLDSVWKGAYFNSNTILPFSNADAVLFGMVYLEKK